MEWAFLWNSFHFQNFICHLVYLPLHTDPVHTVHNDIRKSGSPHVTVFRSQQVLNNNWLIWIRIISFWRLWFMLLFQNEGLTITWVTTLLLLLFYGEKNWECGKLSLLMTFNHTWLKNWCLIVCIKCSIASFIQNVQLTFRFKPFLLEAFFVAPDQINR